MKKAVSVLLLVMCIGQVLLAQKTIERKGNLYFYWGYNRSAYTQSDFHIKGEGYEFTVKGMEATDAPTPVSSEDYLKPSSISTPQYNYRLGYFLTNNISISIGMDHLKYYMIDDQYAVVDGYISAEASEVYQGTYNNEHMRVPWHMLWVHHSDGLNYASVELEYNVPVWISNKKNFYADVLGNIGGGVVVPKSYVRVLHEEVDNKFHVAGGGCNIKLGARFTMWNYFFAEFSGKSGYVWMPNIIVNDEGTAKADQQFGWVEIYGAIGFNIPLGK